MHGFICFLFILWMLLSLLQIMENTYFFFPLQQQLKSFKRWASQAFIISKHFQFSPITALSQKVYLSYGSLTRLIWTSDNVTLLHILKDQLSEHFFHLYVEGLVSVKLRLFQSSTNLMAKETDEALKMRLKTLCGTKLGQAQCSTHDPVLIFLQTLVNIGIDDTSHIINPILKLH